MKIYILGPVRNVSEDRKERMRDWVAQLEMDDEIEVYLPSRDTPQHADPMIISNTNLKAIREADLIQVFFDPDSTGSLFDLGMAYALKKDIKIIENEAYTTEKSFPRLLQDWEQSPGYVGVL